MKAYPYIRIRFPHSDRVTGVTLSVPCGVERALQRGRLPEDAEAFISETDSWIPLAEHPAVSPAFASRTSETEDEVALLDPEQVASLVQARELERRTRRSGQARISDSAFQLEVEKEAGASLWRRRLLAVQRWAAAL